MYIFLDLQVTVAGHYGNNDPFSAVNATTARMVLAEIALDPLFLFLAVGQGMQSILTHSACSTLLLTRIQN